MRAEVSRYALLTAGSQRFVRGESHSLDQIDCLTESLIGFWVFLVSPLSRWYWLLRYCFSNVSVSSALRRICSMSIGVVFVFSFSKTFYNPSDNLTCRVSKCIMRASWAPAFPVLVSIQTYYGRLALSQGTGSWALRVNNSCVSGDSDCGPTYDHFHACCPPASPCQSQYNSVCCPDRESTLVMGNIPGGYRI